MSDTESTLPEHLDQYLRCHLVGPELLRSDDFAAFMADRQKQLLQLIGTATGKPAYSGPSAEEGVDAERNPNPSRGLRMTAKITNERAVLP